MPPRTPPSTSRRTYAADPHVPSSLPRFAVTVKIVALEYGLPGAHVHLQRALQSLTGRRPYAQAQAKIEKAKAEADQKARDAQAELEVR